MGSQPVKNLDDLMKQQPPTSGKSKAPPGGMDPVRFNPFIYGNDIDSVDIATRVAMVSDYIRNQRNAAIINGLIIIED